MGDKETFDVGSFLENFDKEFEDTAVPEVQEETAPAEPEPEVEEAEPVVEEAAEPEPEAEEPLEELEPESKQPETPDVDINDPDIHKRNEAFKKLREEKQKLEESDRLLKELAEQYGLSKEELVKKFTEDKVKKQAEQQGMSVEQFKRVQALEQEVATIREQYQKEAFNFEADRLVKKYNLTEKEAEAAFLQIGAMGVDILANPKLIEPLYKALNYDTALQKGRQAQLQETKKRRETSASPSLGTRGTSVDTSEADMDADIDNFLKERIG